MADLNDEQTVNMTISAAGNVDHTAGLNEDHLGFRPYVEAVYSYLKNDQTKAPFTISIEGDWGSGKSSFMRQLEESLTAAKLPSVNFNAWRYDKIESMWAAFALHFIKELLQQMNPVQRIWANLRLHWARFDLDRGWFAILKMIILFGFYGLLIYIFVKDYPSIKSQLFEKTDINWNKTLPLFGVAGIVVGLLFFLKGVSKVAGNPFKTDLQRFVNKPNYEGNVAFIEEFHKDFEKTVDILTGKQPKVFVFIDDLDRAEVPKAAELMQGLNMMISNSPKLIFIIGMDREKVAGGIAAKYKDLLPFINPHQPAITSIDGLKQARLFGYQFLEKFIQLSFEIPKGTSMFTKQFINSLSDDTKLKSDSGPVQYRPVLIIKDGKDSEQFRAVTETLAEYFDFNPRRIKQFVNIFRLKAHIANSTGLFNDDSAAGIPALTIPQLGKFIAIGMLFPQFIDDLLQDPWLIRKLLTAHEQSDWRNNNILMKLLMLRPNEILDSEESEEYDMANLDIISLMETSPLVVPPTGPASNTINPKTTTTTAPSSANASSNQSSESDFESFVTSGSKRNPPTMKFERKASPKKK